MDLFYNISVLASVLALLFQRGLSLPIQDVSDNDMPFLLKVSPALVNRYTANSIKVTCQINPSVQSKLKELFRIRILKQSSSGWDLVAEQRDVNDSPTVTGNATASANLKGLIIGAFLEVSWDTLGPECFGVFKCETAGFNVKDEILTERSSTLEVFEFKTFINHLIALSVDAQGKIRKMENFTDSEIARLDHRFERLEKSIETKQSLHEDRFNTFESMLASLKRNFTSWKDVIEAKVAKNKNTINDQLSVVGKNLTDTNNVVSALQNDQSNRLDQLEVFQKSLNQWPGGYYALLRPKTGCPLDLAFFGGTHTYLKLHTEFQTSSDPSDDHSAAFGRNTKSWGITGNFVTLEFCENTGQLNAASWPRGTFCVNNLLHHSCPDGFLEGSVYFDTEDTNHVSVKQNNVALGTKPFFCCQDTAPATVPIQLPTHIPFLLYRRGGVCQAIQGMSVSEEFVQINTEDTNNADKLSGRLPDVDQPGSSVIKLNLCYYTKL